MSIDRVPAGALPDLLDAAPDGILLVSGEGRVQYINRAGGELFGYQPEDLIGVAVERLVPGRLHGRHVDERTAYGESPRPRPMALGTGLRGLRSDGTEVDVEISLAPVTLASGPATVAVVRDATQQRQLEAQRLRSAQTSAVEEIVAGLDALVWEAASVDRVQLSYLGGREGMLLGYPRERWLEPGFWISVVVPEDRMAALTIHESAHTQDTFELLYRLRAADGRIRDVRDLVTVVRGPDGAIERLRGVIVDITEQREIAHRLSQAQKMEAVGQLAGGIAHDFNNVVTIVSGYARRLMSRPDLQSARTDLSQIVAAAERASELTRQLLTFARRGHTNVARLDPAAVIRELQPMLRRLLAADIRFDFRLAAPSPEILIDRFAFEQIIMNLLLNASDAMPAGGTLTVRTSPRVVDGDEAGASGATAGDYLEIEVRDTGRGMAADVRERIFEPFFTTKGEKGTGMGLATVYGAVEQAGGWITATSEVGQGTTMTVLLPVAAAETEPASEVAVDRPTLLLVEDESALRALIVTMLEEEGYELLQAANGLDAVAVAKRHSGPIDLLLTDVVMPGLTGPELAHQLRVVRPGLEVLFMSGYNDSRLASRGVEENTINLLIKPFTPDELARRVAELVDPRAG